MLLMTDVEGSMTLWRDEPAEMDTAMARHHEIVHGLIEVHGGWRPIDQGEGDAVFAAFRSPSAAVTCAAQLQRALANETWPTSTPITVRVGVHLGEVIDRGGNLYGDAVNRCARLRGLGHGGQALLSSAVYEVIRDALPPRTSLLDLGEHQMKDLVRPERVWQLELTDLPRDFPALFPRRPAAHGATCQRGELRRHGQDPVA